MNLEFRIKKILHSSFCILSSKRGFTLIEVLVAIAIIGIVFGIIITSTSAIQKQSRDAQRKADLRSIQSALQQYYADANSYPATINSPFTYTSGSNTKTYMTTVPKDPQTKTDYKYCSFSSSNFDSCSSSTCNFYAVCADLENPGSSVSTCSCPASSSFDYQLTPL